MIIANNDNTGPKSKRHCACAYHVWQRIIYPVFGTLATVFLFICGYVVIDHFSIEENVLIVKIHTVIRNGYEKQGYVTSSPLFYLIIQFY